MQCNEWQDLSGLLDLIAQQQHRLCTRTKPWLTEEDRKGQKSNSPDDSTTFDKKGEESTACQNKMVVLLNADASIYAQHEQIMPWSKYRWPHSWNIIYESCQQLITLVECHIWNRRSRINVLIWSRLIMSWDLLARWNTPWMNCHIKIVLNIFACAKSLE